MVPSGPVASMRGRPRSWAYTEMEKPWGSLRLLGWSWEKGRLWGRKVLEVAEAALAPAGPGVWVGDLGVEGDWGFPLRWLQAARVRVSRVMVSRVMGFSGGAGDDPPRPSP